MSRGFGVEDIHQRPTLLVLRLSALGDVIHTIPAVCALRAALPQVQMRWVVEAPYRELVEVVAGVEAIPVRMKRWGRTLIASRTEIRGALRTMRSAAIAVDFQGLLKSAALGWLSGAAYRIGFDRRAIREKPALLFTNHKVPVDVTMHVVDQNLELAAGVAEVLHQSFLPGPGREADWSAFPQPSGLGRDFAGAVVLLPGAGKPGKLWPVERFRELARQIGPRALAVWGPGERELATATGARVAPPTNLRELAWLLQKAEVVIGADTGPLHLADALGSTVIGLYGPTDPRRNGPYHQLEHCIDRYQTTKWMDSIAVEEVMTMLETVRRG